MDRQEFLQFVEGNIIISTLLYSLLIVGIDKNDKEAITAATKKWAKESSETFVVGLESKGWTIVKKEPSFDELISN